MRPRTAPRIESRRLVDHVFTRFVADMKLFDFEQRCFAFMGSGLSKDPVSRPKALITKANVILTYPSAVAILQASWNWPFDRKDMELYGRTGSAKTILRDKLDVRREGEKEAHMQTAPALAPPYDDSLHYFVAAINGQTHDANSLSSLKTNLIVTEILDAARRSADTGRTITLPLEP